VTDDALSAALAPIRERSRWISSAAGIAAPGATAVKSAEDVPRLLAAVDAALKLADELAGPDDSAEPSALTEDRTWVRQACAERLRGAIASTLTGKEAGGE
jgi:hypothetical protein